LAAAEHTGSYDRSWDYAVVPDEVAERPLLAQPVIPEPNDERLVSVDSCCTGRSQVDQFSQM